MKKESLQKAILVTLLASRDRRMTAVEVMKEFKRQGTPKSRKDINHTLYEYLEPSGLVIMEKTGGRPYWVVAERMWTQQITIPKESEDLSSERVSVLIDLGNVHDCLVPAARLLEVDKGFDLYGYADLGTNPPGSDIYEQYLVRENSGRPSGADIAMVMDATLLLERKKASTLIVLSNDKLLATFVDIARTRYSEVETILITGNKAWGELREYLE